MKILCLFEYLKYHTQSHHSLGQKKHAGPRVFTSQANELLSRLIRVSSITFSNPVLNDQEGQTQDTRDYLRAVYVHVCGHSCPPPIPSINISHL